MKGWKELRRTNPDWEGFAEGICCLAWGTGVATPKGDMNCPSLSSSFLIVLFLYYSLEYSKLMTLLKFWATKGETSDI